VDAYVSGYAIGRGATELELPGHVVRIANDWKLDGATPDRLSFDSQVDEFDVGTGRA
jgi:hypothetical protein